VPPRPAPAAREAARRERREALGLPPDAPLLVAAGRLEPKKGADLLPGLALALRERLPGATLAALGEGPMRAALAGHRAATGRRAAARQASCPPRGGPPRAETTARRRTPPPRAGPPPASRTPPRSPPAGTARRCGCSARCGTWGSGWWRPTRCCCPRGSRAARSCSWKAAARLCPVVATAAALEAFGDAAWDLAAIAADDAVSALADGAAAALTPPAAARRLRVEAAFLRAARWDEAAMLREYAGLLRAAAAAAAASPAAA
jgi:hypothetical protein